MMETFTNPFRYSPHPMVRQASRQVIGMLDRMISEGRVPEEVARDFSDGKMLGVLICRSKDDEMVTLAAFSGSVGGTSIVEGFVPPIFDLTENDGYYRKHEAEISGLNHDIERIRHQELEPLAALLNESAEARDQEIGRLRDLKKDAQSIRESQFANGEIKRAKDRWKAVISRQEADMQEVRERIDALKKLRAQKSDGLQRWIFEHYIVHNAAGGKASILDIFGQKGLMPPGGTGDCAAPKLLDHAYLNGLKPLAMGEFWYGKSPSTAVRTHGHFYPSCTSKCGPLLSYMMQGLDVAGDDPVERTCHPRLGGVGFADGGPCNRSSPATSDADNHIPATLIAEIVYEDGAVIVADKPSGMPSVPGLDGRESLQEYLKRKSGIDVIPVHRLDMDTSGIIVFAKTPQAEISLKRQFEEHTVRKTYIARLCPPDTHRFTCGIHHLKAGDKGRIELPLSPDYDERPRQKVDLAQGKPAMTEYEVMSTNEDGTTDILFYPHTGRTHQLRVHSAHTLGLGRPILGDLLYGSDGAACTRLHLHACSISFHHPTTGTLLTFSTAPRRDA